MPLSLPAYSALVNSNKSNSLLHHVLSRSLFVRVLDDIYPLDGMDTSKPIAFCEHLQLSSLGVQPASISFQVSSHASCCHGRQAPIQPRILPILFSLVFGGGYWHIYISLVRLWPSNPTTSFACGKKSTSKIRSLLSTSRMPTAFYVAL